MSFSLFVSVNCSTVNYSFICLVLDDKFLDGHYEKMKNHLLQALTCFIHTTEIVRVVLPNSIFFNAGTPNEVCKISHGLLLPCGICAHNVSHAGFSPCSRGSHIIARAVMSF